MAKLTDKQEKFVQELIKGKSQREAYRIAYPKCKAKDKTVDEYASRLMKNSKVLARYNEINDRLIKEAEDECIVEAKDILKQLTRIALADSTDYAKVVTKPMKKRYWDNDLQEYVYSEGEFDQFVEVIDTDQLSKSKTAVIKSIKQGRYGIEIELYSKDKALELLGRHLGLFKDKLEIKDDRESPVKGLTTEELKKVLGLI